MTSIKRKSPKPNKNSELLQSKSWYVPPLVQVQKAALLPPPPPAAPQLTFTFTGRLFDENEVILFLSRNSKQYIAKVGDVLDDSYRVDQITNMNVVLTYLPMNIQQTLTFNSTAIGSLSANDLPPNKLMLVPLTANNKNSKN